MEKELNEEGKVEKDQQYIYVPELRVMILDKFSM